MATLDNSDSKVTVDVSEERVPTSVNALSVPIPPFRDSNPRLWFRQLEATFALRGVSSELTKYYHVVAALPPNIADDVEDLLDTPDPRQPYEVLRDAIIRRFGVSTHQQVLAKIEAAELGDQTPSQLLRYLQRINGGQHFDEPTIREYWLKKLPKHMQAILRALPGAPLDETANSADQIHQTYLGTVHNVGQREESQIATLSSQLANLTKEVESLRQARSRSRSRRALRSPIRRYHNSPHPDFLDVCWYHRKFGADSRKCRPPCSFFNKGQGNGQASA